MDGTVKPVFAFDFDGTLTTHTVGYTGPTIEDGPVDGAADWLTGLAPALQLVCFSARAREDDGIQAIRSWLNDNGFGDIALTITDRKPATAFAILDDLGLNFTGPGGYPSLDTLLAFKPWWKHDSDKPFPQLQARTPEEAVATLEARARTADFPATETITRIVAMLGGGMSGLEDRIKTPASLAGKLANVMAEKKMTLAQAAADIKDTLRYTAVYEPADFAAAVGRTLDLLDRSAGLTIERVRNYWQPQPASRYAEGTYVGVNVVLRAPSGFPLELQFHTPQSLDVQAINWGFYRILRSGEAGADADQIVRQMRDNNRLVQPPPGIEDALTASADGTDNGGIPASANYRPASDLAFSCATCSYGGSGMYGRCGMWDKPVDMAWTCDEWQYGQPVESARPDEWNPEPEAINVHPLTAAAPDVTGASTMVCVKPRPSEAAALASTDGEAADTLHITLAYLGETDGDLAVIAQALGPVAASHAPLAGEVAGYGVFKGEELWPAILLPDVPGLVELRVAVTEALLGAGHEYARTHGFEAHITVDYLDPDGTDDTPFRDDQAGQPLHFDELLVVRGDTEIIPVPFTGSRPITAAAPPARPVTAADHNKVVQAAYARVEDLEPRLVAILEPILARAGRRAAAAFTHHATEHLVAAGQWTAPAGDELVDVPALVAELRSRTDPVRKAFVKAVMTPALKKAGIAFDITNPLTARAFATSARHVTSIAETTRANVMKIVQESYTNGLSIPQTAEAIKAGMKEASITRATMIARTELVGAMNAGSLAATQIVSDVTGVEMSKVWMTAPGAQYPRHETYEGLDGQTVALTDAFDVGGEQLMYPGDPDGDPGETINCRCSLSYSDGSPGTGAEDIDG